MHLTEAEKSLMDIIWEKREMPAKELVSLADERLDWRRTTMYTILKKLIEKGMVQNENARVKCLVSEEEYEALQKKSAIRKYFSGSLPEFVNAFIREEKLSEKDIQELEEIINSYKESRGVDSCKTNY
jgi:predicted transcriptional regulator